MCCAVRTGVLKIPLCPRTRFAQKSMFTDDYPPGHSAHPLTSHPFASHAHRRGAWTLPQGLEGHLRQSPKSRSGRARPLCVARQGDPWRPTMGNPDCALGRHGALEIPDSPPSDVRRSRARNACNKRACDKWPTLETARRYRSARRGAATTLFPRVGALSMFVGRCSGTSGAGQLAGTQYCTSYANDNNHRSHLVDSVQ